MKEDKNKSILKRTQLEAQKLLEAIGVQGEIETKEEDEIISVTVNTEEIGILIGRHGETISAFELLLNQIINRGEEEWKRIVVDTGGYKQKQEEKLKEIALSAAQKVKETGNPYSLYDLTSAQRRIIHMILAEDDSIMTESQGEGRDRCLVVSARP